MRKRRNRICATIAVLPIFAAFADVPYDFSGNFDVSNEAGPVKAEFGRAKLIPDGQNHWGTLVVTTPSRVTVPIGDGATEFTASGGVDADSKVDSCARFRILAPDGRVLCEKEGVKKGKWSAVMKADLTGLDAIVLEVSGEDGILAGWFWGKVSYAKGRYPPSDVRNFSPQLGILTPPERPEPRINGPSVYGVRPGHPIIYRLPVTGQRPVRLKVESSKLKVETVGRDHRARRSPGLSFNPDTHVLTGSIKEPGEYKLTFTVENREGRACRDLTIKVGEKIALTPAMGWNSWNCFGGNVTADDIRNAADAFERSGLADHGYAYVNIDDFWQNNPKSSDKRLHGPLRDENGKINSNLRFPDMKGLADYIHSKGFRAGLYSSPGPTTCGGCTGSWQHEEQDAQTYAEWGFDYLKHDWCSYSKVATGEGVERAMKPYRIMGNALRAQNRDILFSLCQYGNDDVATWGAKVGGQSWRITGDILDKWGSVMHAVKALKKVWQYSAPGEFNDPDMLCIGPMHWNNFTASRLAPNEQYTHISLWALAAAPLMIGCDMTKLDGFTRALLANDEVIAIDQDVLGLAAAPIVDKWSHEIWARPLADGSIAVGLVNKEMEEREIAFDMKSAGMEGEWTVRDVWRQKDEGTAKGIYKTGVYGHATHLVRFIPGKGALLRVRDIRDNALADDAKAVKPVDKADGGCESCGERRKSSAPGFDASKYPPAARPYREAALMAYDFIFQSPGARHLLATGETDPKCRVNAYPTKMMSAMIEAMLRYARLRPETKGEALQIARAAADYLIAHSEKPGSPLASCPPTYETRPELKVTAAKTYEGQMMMIYPADAGSAYLKLARVTGDVKYGDAAVAIAETYLRLQGEDGTWPLMMYLDDGRPNGSHRLIPTGVADFLLAVADATGEAKYCEAASRAFEYIENGPCRTFDWSAQFEDVGVKKAPYSNLTKDEAVDYARHILDVFPGDAAKAEEARKLLEFGENLFVHWERSGRHQEWTEFPCVCEQQNYNVPVDASAAKMIEAYLAFYKATKDPIDLAKAKALGDSITRAQFDFGDIPTVWTREWVEKQRNDRRGGWLNCTVAAALALEHLADVTEDGRPTGCPDFDVELPRTTNGAVVKAVDFGFSETNENNIIAINAALAEAKRIGAHRVELAPGTYRCFERTRGEKGIAIEGFEDFTFDGMGATLVFRRDHEPLPSQDTLLEYGANVTVRGCRRTVVENFNMDWDWETDPLAVWCRCVGKHVDDVNDNSSWADFELDSPHPKYPQHVPVQLLTPFASDKSGSRMDVANGPRYLLGTSLGCIGSKSEWLSPMRLRVWPGVRPDYGHFPREQVGLCAPDKNLEDVKRLHVGGVCTLSHRYYGLNGFVIDSNEHFTLRNIDLWACQGFGVETRGAQKYWQLVNFNIRPKPGERRPVTSTADAHHFIRSRGYGKMIGCEVSMNQDDYFNIHDRTQIAQKRSARTVEVVNSRGIGYTGFGPGTRIRLRHEDYSDAGWTGSIVKIDGETVTFDRDLPEQKGMLFVLIDDEYASENFIFKDCRFHDSPWARGLVQCNNVTFDGCVFGPMSGLPLKFMTCYSYNVWCEGIGCSNIVVRNCRFENCLADNSWHVLPNAPLITASMLLPPEYSRMEDSVPILHPGFARQVAENKAAGRKVKPSMDAVCDILVERNTFVNPRGLVLLTENASRVTFRDNKVESDGSAWEPFSFAGKIRLVGGAGNDVPEEYLESALERRVEETLARLTLEQKIGQLWQGLGKNAVEPASSDMSGERLKESFLAEVRAGRYGSLIGKRGVENYNIIQRAAMEGVGIPLLIGNDMIHSVVTTYPIPLALACSWDESLWERIAAAMATESLLEGCNWTFTPMLDVALDARWGRIAEGGGCDPLVTGLMGAAMIRGFQGEDMADGLHIAACAKHYVCYGASLGGRDYNAVELSDDTLRNTYLPPFRMAVEAGVATVMPAFHSYNGVPCSMNRYLLRDILRGEMGFDGMTISDWGAVKQLIPHGTAFDEADAAAKAINAGMDMEMVTGCYAENLASLVKEGRVGLKTLDDAVRNVLRVKLRLGLFDHPEIDKAKVAASVDSAANRALAREAAQKSIVLLKNEAGTLPLKSGVKVALLGDVSANAWQMLGCWSTCDLSNFENATLLEGLKADGVDVTYTEAYTLTGRVDTAEIAKAADVADVVIAAFGDYWEKSGEGNSSSRIELPGNQLEAARAVKACGKPLVAVVFGGRPMAFPELAGIADAVVMAWNPGGCGGWGIADVLTGAAEPRGRLTVDIPRTTGVCPLFYSQTTTGRPAVVDKDNPFGVRFTSCYNDVEPSALYPFGFGLAYTTFAYSGETANVCGDEVVFTVDVANAGGRDGSELVQLYVRDKVAKIARPRRELKAFKRVELKSGETKRVELRVPVANLGYWTNGSYAVEPGGFTAWIAPDSASGRPIDFNLDPGISGKKKGKCENVEL